MPSPDAALFAYLAPYLTPERRQRFEEVLAWRTRFLTVAVEELHKPRNTSAVLRTCDCFGIQDVHVIATQAPYRISKNIASGAQQWLTLYPYRGPGDNTQHCLDQLRGQGYRIVATTPHPEALPLEALPLMQKTALFFGSEETGLSPQILDQAEARLRVPMKGFTESYNLSVSAALVLYALTTRLHAQPPAQWRLSEAEQMALRVTWAERSLKHGGRYVRRFWAYQGEKAPARPPTKNITSRKKKSP